MKPEHDLHKKSEEIYRQLLNGIKDPGEKHGEFYIISGDDRIIGFEVYTPEEPLSLSSKNLKKNKLEIEGGRGLISGGLDPNRRNQLIERLLNVKGHQFTSKVTYPKILIVCGRYPKAFSGLDALFDEQFDKPVNDKLLEKFQYCSAIMIDSGLNNIVDVVNNIYAKYPVPNVELDNWKKMLEGR